MKKLIEKTFFQLEDFTKMDDTLLKMIKEQTSGTGVLGYTSTGFHERSHSEQMASYMTH